MLISRGGLGLTRMDSYKESTYSCLGTLSCCTPTSSSCLALGSLLQTQWHHGSVTHHHEALTEYHAGAMLSNLYNLHSLQYFTTTTENTQTCWLTTCSFHPSCVPRIDRGRTCRDRLRLQSDSSQLQTRDLR